MLLRVGSVSSKLEKSVNALVVLLLQIFDPCDKKLSKTENIYGVLLV
jgi:hypothetical protein